MKSYPRRIQFKNYPDENQTSFGIAHDLLFVNIFSLDSFISHAATVTDENAFR